MGETKKKGKKKSDYIAEKQLNRDLYVTRAKRIEDYVENDEKGSGAGSPDDGGGA